MVEIIPQKPKTALPVWRWPLWLSAILLLLSVAAFMLLKVYLSQIQAEIVNINNQIKMEAAKVNADDENSIARLNDSFGVFNSLVSNHSYFSNVLDMIGSLTYQKIVFTKFDASRETNLIQLKGVAQNYTALAKQMVALRENPNVKSLDVKGMSFGTNGLDFELVAAVEPKIFVKEQAFVQTSAPKAPETNQRIPETPAASSFDFGAFFENAWSWISNAIQILGDAIQGAIQGVINLIQGK